MKVSFFMIMWIYDSFYCLILVDFGILKCKIYFKLWGCVIIIFVGGRGIILSRIY